MKTDCRDYGERELVLWFQNDEHFYNALKNSFRVGMSFRQFKNFYVDEYFLYYPDQLNELASYYESELIEYESNPNVY